MHVLVETYVTRVIPATEGGNDFRVIEVAAGEDSERKQVVAEKEIIVAGGIFGTPQILLNSGIGTRDELEAVGINTLVENPSVGKNLSDHVAAQLLFSTNIQGTGYVPFVPLLDDSRSTLKLISCDGDIALTQWLLWTNGTLRVLGLWRNPSR